MMTNMMIYQYLSYLQEPISLFSKIRCIQEGGKRKKNWFEIILDI